MKMATQAESELKGAEQSEWIEWLEREHDNLQAALAWSLENDTAVALQLAETLGQFWFMRGHHFGEGIEWLERVLSREEAPGQVASRARAFRWLGTLTYFQGNYDAARSAYEQSLALSQEMQDMDNIAEAFFYLADTAASQGDAAAARTLYAQARSFALDNLTSLRKLGDKWNIARTLNTLGEMARVGGDYAAARKFYEESLLIRQELGDQRGIAVSLINLGFVAYDGGYYQQAAVFFEESLVLFQKHGGKRGVVDCLTGLAGVIGRAGQPERAARLLGSMEAVREAIRIGSTVSYADRLEYDRYESAVRAQLDETSFAAAWAEGRRMTLEQAVAYALLETETLSPVPNVKEIFGGLTAREREAAALIAQGKSNREIAEEMTVRVKTAETYVTRILKKLGFDSRVQIAIWAIEKSLRQPTQAPKD
jgi:non-specific serine/threonine protein kinase